MKRQIIRIYDLPFSDIIMFYNIIICIKDTI